MIMFNKKSLIYAGLFVASFLVINVGVFFFLKMTQPKVGARITDSNTVHAAGDSLAHANATPVDSTLKDSTQQVADASTPADTAKNSDHAAALPAAEEVQPAVTEEAQAPEETASQKPETEKAEAVDEQPADNTEAVVTAALAGDAKEMSKLAKLLESMKPGEAADIVSHLSTDQIVTLVMKMKDRSAGKMLAALPIEQAARVAERMSQTASRSRGG
jgi:flagellar motility protein MotE (MotC chaperone)